MVESLLANDVPPPYARLYSLERRLLDEIVKAGADGTEHSPLERDLLQLVRSTAIAIGGIRRISLRASRRRDARIGSAGRMLASDAQSFKPSEVPTSSSGEDRSEYLYDEALRLVTGYRNGSTSWLQRQLAISYNQALSLMSRLEERGVISTADPQGRRDVITDKPTFST